MLLAVSPYMKHAMSKKISSIRAVNFLKGISEIFQRVFLLHLFITV